MSSINSVSFASQSSIIAPPVQRKSSQEIAKERIHEQAKDAKAKPAEEKNVGDYIAIGFDTVNRVTENIPVVIYANQPQKLSYMA
ncbi:MAG: hypothetical protein ACI37R_06890 [Candidatus Avigastranaerophilus sp.]